MSDGILAGMESEGEEERDEMEERKSKAREAAKNSSLMKSAHCNNGQVELATL